MCCGSSRSIVIIVASILKEYATVIVIIRTTKVACDFKEGSKVSVKLAAFPYQEHGTLDGIVRSISEDAFEKDTPQGPMAIYRARIQIEDPSQLIGVKSSRLSAGMTTVAEIKVGKRRVIKYFLYPLIRSWDTSLREP